MSHRQEAENSRQPNQSFSVDMLGDVSWLYLVATGLAKVDMVKDKRFGSVDLSKTRFETHPVFASESSYLSAHNVDRRRPAKAHPRLQLSSFLTFTDSYTQGESAGYIPDSRAVTLREAVGEQLPNMEVTLQRVSPNNHIHIKKDQAVINVDLGPSSLEAKQADLRRFEEVKKEALHPEGTLHAKYLEMLALVPLPEQTEEDKEWENTWREMVTGGYAGSSLARIDESKNKSIRLELESTYGTDLEELFDAIEGVPLTTPDKVKAVVDFYRSGYAAFVNAFCEVEGVSSPSPRVLLGSARIS